MHRTLLFGHNRAMHFLERTLDTPEENLALDEALLDWAETTSLAEGLLRLWEPDRPFVVLGRSSRAAAEVDLGACDAAKIPVLRRSSGGASIIAGPGCLMYAVVLSYERWPALQALDQAHRFVLERHVEALRPFLSGVVAVGTSDLAFGKNVLKFSGNSLRCKRTHFVYHGTFLYDLDLSLLERCLRHPPRAPEYRGDRLHNAFVTNCPLARADLVAAIRRAWEADTPMDTWPKKATGELVRNRYATDAWTYCFE